MKIHRFWIEILMVGTAVAFALALLIATLGAVVGAFAQDTNSSSAEKIYEGMVTCSRCGARHSVAIGKAADDCTRSCVHAGANFALVDGDKTYLLDGNLIDLKKVAGERVRITGIASGNTIRVSSVAAGS